MNVTQHEPRSKRARKEERPDSTEFKEREADDERSGRGETDLVVWDWYKLEKLSNDDRDEYTRLHAWLVDL